MRTLYFLFFCFLPFSVTAEHVKQINPMYSESSNLKVQNINKATEVIRDPTIAVGKIKQALNDTGKAIEKAVQENLPLPEAKPIGTIQDPTQLNGSFTDALRRLSKRQNKNEPSSYKLPDISLAAKTFSKDGNNSSALLNINQRLYFVKPGGSFSFMQNNEIYEIDVEKIDIHSVHIRISPINETLILR